MKNNQNIASLIAKLEYEVGRVANDMHLLFYFDKAKKTP